jgi:catechol 2,3-dioxygenase-like lactoylglutathione lyase family enzyme
MTPNASSFVLSQVGQISITVHQIEKAVAFYRDFLGIQFLFQAPNMAFFACGSLRLMLAVPEKPEFDHPSSVIYFKVDNIQRAFDTLSVDVCAIRRQAPFHRLNERPRFVDGFFPRR